MTNWTLQYPDKAAQRHYRPTPERTRQLLHTSLLARIAMLRALCIRTHVTPLRLTKLSKKLSQAELDLKVLRDGA